ncbi:SURF1 family protein [Sphingomonas koreensis]|nr:SURF1 family protein [Sphingomonas koreensis]
MTGGGDRIVSPPAFDDAQADRRPRSALAIGLFFAIGLAIFAGFVALGVWQVHRLAWKRALIDRVAHRIHAPPAPAPGPSEWPTISAARDEYRHIAVTGRFENDRETLVEASTDLGPGFWVVTPFDTSRGFAVLVNRGFVPPERRDARSRADGQPAGVMTLTGLLRLTEPKGRLLRTNDPAAGRWYSRDVAAIAKARGLAHAAPYFIDADRTAGPADAPVGGLTVVDFPNNHLQYALTWFALAILTLVGLGLLLRDERRLRIDRAAGD